MLLSRSAINDSLTDAENRSEDSTGQIYELDEHNLELGQLIGQVIIRSMAWMFWMNEICNWHMTTDHDKLTTGFLYC